MSPVAKRIQLLLSVLSVLLLLGAAAAAWFWWAMRGSLATLDGTRGVAGLSAPVKIERDAWGVPLISAASRADAARGLGFLHAQERFFQMDLMRRRSAGELAELFGEAAVPADQEVRVHGFRRLAGESFALMPAAHRAVLEAYAEGVNAGLGSLRRKPWEYLVLRTDPGPWRPEDSLLVVHAMWLDLQDSQGRYEMTLRAVRLSLGDPALSFFAPRGDSWDAALDGSSFPAAPLPPLRLKRRDDTAASPAPAPTFAGRDAAPPTEPRGALPADRLGSNSFAVAGEHTASGAALLENDMHLDLRVPNTWYRAAMAWTDGDGEARRVVGVTLPGAPALVAGSNGRIAWGFTNSYIDTSDIILVETDSAAQFMYRTTRGWVEIVERTEAIKVKGGEDATVTIRSTEWGPIIGGPEEGRYYAVRWTAHAPEATDFGLMELENGTDVAEAVAAAHRAGIPHQNLVVADRTGAIAWTVSGKIPRRHGFDGRLPVSWAYGDRYWDGWLRPEEIPVVTTDPGKIPGALAAPDGILWSANQRHVGGEAYARLGDGGYDEGARAAQIRDGLRELVSSGKKATPADLLRVALDDRALFLERWKNLLLSVLTDEAVRQKKDRGELREVVRRWGGRSTPDSAAYRLVRAFRTHVHNQALNPLLGGAASSYAGFSPGRLISEDAVWRLLQEKPVRLLNPDHATWDDLLLASADAVLADVVRERVTPAQFTWGRRNSLRMQHPFSRFLPKMISRFLDMPQDPLPGDSFMPRAQSRLFGASERLIVAPGREEEGIFHMPGGQSGHPLSPFYRAGHRAWVEGEPAPLLPGPVRHTLVLEPK